MSEPRHRPANCRCVADWREVRRALGLSAHKLALIQGTGDRVVLFHEDQGDEHRCMSRGAEMLLRIYCRSRAALFWNAGVPYPWPDDLKPRIEICPRCKLDVLKHRRCKACNILIGKGHLAESRAYHEHCQMCGDWMLAHPVPAPPPREPVTAGRWVDAHVLLSEEVMA